MTHFDLRTDYLGHPALIIVGTKTKKEDWKPIAENIASAMFRLGLVAENNFILEVAEIEDTLGENKAFHDIAIIFKKDTKILNYKGIHEMTNTQIPVESAMNSSARVFQMIRLPWKFEARLGEQYG